MAGRGWSFALVAIVALLLPGASSAGQQGDELRVGSIEGPNSIDPAFAVSRDAIAILSTTCLNLLNYRDREGPAGARLIPEAAERMPSVSRDGRTYTFTIRRGLRFSDGRRLTAANYEEAAYRVLHPRMNSLVLLSGGGDDIFGLREFKTGKTTRLAGIHANGRTLTVRLTRPNPDILHRLATTFACPVPVGFPLDPTGVEDPPVTGSGPYYIQSYRPRVEVALRRNPYYRGARPRSVDVLRVLIGGTRQGNAEEVERGDLDYSFDGPPEERLPELVARYGIDREQLWVKTRPATVYLALNTARPLFRDNAALRKAVNFALDRREIVRQAGHPGAARPTDQLLPPSMPGVRDAHLYPTSAPALGVARRLARGRLRGGRAILYVTNVPVAQRRARIVQLDLAKIGLEVEIRSYAPEVISYRLRQRGEPYDLGMFSWGQDIPDPANFLVPILHGRSIPTGPPATLALATLQNNFSRFDDPEINARLDKAVRLTGEPRLHTLAGIEADVLRDLAPIAPLYNPTDYILVSKRVGCVTYTPVFRLDLTALCIK